MKVCKLTCIISKLKDVMQPRVPGIKVNEQNAFILQNKSSLKKKIPRQQNITVSPIAYTNSVLIHVKSRNLSHSFFISNCN